MNHDKYIFTFDYDSLCKDYEKVIKDCDETYEFLIGIKERKERLNGIVQQHKVAGTKNQLPKVVFDERKKINQFCKKDLRIIAHQMEKQLELLIRGEQEHMKQEMSDFEREELTHKYAGVKRRIKANISLIKDI